MKVFIAAIIATLAVAVASAEISAQEITANGYHKKVGIPEANRIRKLEEQAIKNGQNRIVGGSVTNIADFPFQAGLIMTIMFIFNSVCGGSLISQTRVVTAAHCHSDGTFTAQSFDVILGSSFIFSGGVRNRATRVISHPNWNPNTAANDIAILVIPSVTLTNVIQPIALPSGNELTNNFVNQVGRASGFGLTSDGGSIGTSQRLSFVDLPIIADSECARIYSSWYHSSNICTSGAGGRGTCQGDSGGPLTVVSNNRRILTGVTSYGHIDGCTSGNPAAYARVTSYVPWILAQ